VLVYNPPTPEDCLAIANGIALDRQDEMIARSFDIDMDVTLDVGSSLNDTLLGYLERRLQTVLTHPNSTSVSTPSPTRDPTPSPTSVSTPKQTRLPIPSIT
jgi:hypothetical protein